MTTTIQIPLSKLLAWEGNVRKTSPDKAIDELAASIMAHGLLQSLVVRKDKRGKYAVVAGRRRLLALTNLAEEKKIESDMPIPCHVIDEDADATEISLAENVQREAMHPADEFDAFKTLIETGLPVADVAARFGVTETVVQKRLKLAKVNPALVTLYRKGEMTLQHIMAFAVTDDHDAQLRVWQSLADWQKDDPEIIRDQLIEDEVSAEDRRVKFVTLKAYEKAGGTVRRDLFSEDETGVFIEDVILLESLVAKKLEKTAAATVKEGWKWVEIRPLFAHAEWSHCKRRHPQPSFLPPIEEAELEALQEEYDNLLQNDERDDEQEARFETIGERIEVIEDRPTVWPAETLAIAGCVVTLGSDGEPDVHSGYIRPEDAPKAAQQPDETSEESTDTKARDPLALSASLVEDLTAHRSLAISASLMEQPGIALAATVHAMALPVFYNAGRGDTALQIASFLAGHRSAEGSQAHTAIEAVREQWVNLMPSDESGLLTWCLAQPQELLLKLLAFCAAQTINAVRVKADHPDDPRLQCADHLADALRLDMATWFTVNAGNYFGRVSKPVLIEALREVKGAVAPAWSGMKKAELVSLAERETAKTQWLPNLLRKAA